MLPAETWLLIKYPPTGSEKNPTSLISELCFTIYNESPTGNPIVEWWNSFTPGEGKSPTPTTSEEHGQDSGGTCAKGQDVQRFTSLFHWSPHLDVSIWLKYFLSRDPISLLRDSCLKHQLKVKETLYLQVTFHPCQHYSDPLMCL